MNQQSEKAETTATCPLCDAIDRQTHGLLERAIRDLHVELQESNRRIEKLESEKIDYLKIMGRVLAQQRIQASVIDRTFKFLNMLGY